MNGSTREGSQIDHGDHFDDGISATYIDSETASSRTEEKDWPLPAKSY